MGSLTIKKAPTAAEQLHKAQRQQLRQFNDDYDAAAKPLIKDYPEAERLSWAKQLDEASRYREWQEAGENGTAPPTPALNAILKGRNNGDGTETLADLVTAVLTRADAFIQWQEYTGIRHRGERLILNAETIEDVQAVTWESLTS
ncbi:hypothetical protein KZO83_07725 [Chromohalobacter sp. TMW 2.2308]|uniref:hypothetical protein n=1 Tax=Chromohalobacter TaxID=42054 RepID=UPI001FFD5486|nr:MULTISPECIES: hypothetical protein [Chromohalobacter]MCK2042576.1 hypothetical protein [Chromohalobacter moromii]MCT8514906.1 hypothetical protein [Chromohalobacter sp. TMW 2.2271]